MNVIDIPINQLVPAPFSPNQMDEAMSAHLAESLRRFGTVSNLIVRSMGQGSYEVLSGNQRVKALMERSAATAPCVVVELDDTDARLLTQAINGIHGEDDPAKKASLLRQVLIKKSIQETQALLPESAEALASLADLGSIDLGEHLVDWEASRKARLKHMTFQVTAGQQEVVKQALNAIPADEIEAARDGSPNRNGTALYCLAKRYLDSEVDA